MWAKLKRKAKDPFQSDGDSLGEDGSRLVDEVAAFLSGSSKEWFLGEGRQVPVWAYLNKVVHSEPQALRRLGARAPQELGLGAGWRQAVAVLAKETVDLAGGDFGAIRRLQLECLFPLESALMSRNTQGMSAQGLVTVTRVYLRDHPGADPA